ncbi:MAG: hypothetical protein ACRDG4_19230, partial [Chloroflexota bacterium]
HGDAHAWSFMLPRDTEADRVMVIDWQLWEINAPTDDLAYLMAFWWAPGVAPRWKCPCWRPIIGT